MVSPKLLLYKLLSHFKILSMSSRPVLSGFLSIQPFLNLSLPLLLQCPFLLPRHKGATDVLACMHAVPATWTSTLQLISHLLGLSSNVTTLPDLFSAIIQAYNNDPIQIVNAE